MPIIKLYRKLTARLEHRMVFAKYSIEKCYLLHQISQSYLDQGRHSECAFNARKAIKGKQTSLLCVLALNNRVLKFNIIYIILFLKMHPQRARTAIATCGSSSAWFR